MSRETRYSKLPSTTPWRNTPTATRPPQKRWLRPLQQPEPSFSALAPSSKGLFAALASVVRLLPSLRFHWQLRPLPCFFPLHHRKYNSWKKKRFCTAWKLNYLFYFHDSFIKGHFHLTILPQKFREINAFIDKWRCTLFSRNFVYYKYLDSSFT